MLFREQFGVQRQRCFKQCGQDYLSGTVEIRRGKTFIVHPYSSDDPIFRSIRSEWSWHNGPGQTLIASCLRNNTVYGPDDTDWSTFTFE
eukprot:1784429-Karenia_brevis.AAC.1